MSSYSRSDFDLLPPIHLHDFFWASLIPFCSSPFNADRSFFTEKLRPIQGLPFTAYCPPGLTLIPQLLRLFYTKVRNFMYTQAYMTSTLRTVENIYSTSTTLYLPICLTSFTNKTHYRPSELQNCFYLVTEENMKFRFHYKQCTSSI